MQRMMMGVLATIVLLSPATLSAHGGGLNADGCHNNRKTGGYHCHGGESKKSSKTTKSSSSGGYTFGSKAKEEPKKKEPRRVQAIVTEVHDGDTITVIVGGRDTWKVRIKGIDCPEASDNAKCQRDENCDAAAGARATARLTELILGLSVILESAVADDFEKDRYGRVLAYVERSGTDVGLELIQGDYCVDFSKKYPHPRELQYRRFSRH